MRRRNGKRAVRSTPLCGEDAAVRKLTAKILLTFNAVGRLVHEHGFYRDSVAEILGVTELEEKIYDEKGAVIGQIKKVCGEILSQESREYPQTLQNNVSRLKALVGLSDLEADILKFAVMIHYAQALEDACELLGDMTSTRAVATLAKILGYDKEAVREALSPRSALGMSGLVSLDRDGMRSLCNKLDLLSRSFADMMVNYEGDDLYELFKDSIRTVSPGSLGLDDYDHMAKERDMLLKYLRSVMADRKSGSHILIYGRPGTGKTELVKALAEALGVALFEVSYADEDDEPIGGRQRIKAFKSAQYLLGHKPSLLLFDEIEDIYEEETTPIFMPRAAKQNHKGWMNRILENAKVPTVWLSNSVAMMDPATLRRFDVVLRMPEPTRSKRRQIAENALGGVVSDAMIETLAECDDLAPALVTRAAEVLETMGVNSVEEADEAVGTLISGTLLAQRHRLLPKPKTLATGEYDPGFVNASENLARLAEGIAEHPCARLCLYGPPGTGKSAFGRWLALRLDRPCIVKKGSDLLSMWVGETEANIARAFAEAEREEAVLVFDEVDGFLQDRRDARQSWEVTQVNEMLTQMESFEGIFIATTNLMENLDAASLRRFDLKIEFRYMRREQAWSMLTQACRRLGLGTPGDEALHIVASIPNLTPGDFAAVARRHRFSPVTSAEDLADKLKEECEMKNEEGGHDVMGFVA